MELARPLQVALLAFTLGLVQTGCSSTLDDEEPTDSPESYVEHEEPLDFVVDPDGDTKADAISPTVFDRNAIVSDTTFRNTRSMSVQDVQRFLEKTPYGKRCFLADQKFNGKPAAQWIVDSAVKEGINPILLLTRMQLEQSLISKTARPTRQSAYDHALGCGCRDSQACSSAYEGFVNQIKCGAELLSDRYDTSVDGSRSWRKGACRKSSDNFNVCPSTHGTASLYAYTPWVRPNRGGNWLMWNLIRKYVTYAQSNGWYRQ